MDLSDDELRRLGTTLERVDPRHLRDGEHRLWWRGQEPYFELVAHRDDAAFDFIEVSLRGRVLSFRDGALRIGETNELTSTSEQNPGVKLVQALREDDQMVSQMLTLLSGSTDEDIVDIVRTLKAAR